MDNGNEIVTILLRHSLHDVLNNSETFVTLHIASIEARCKVQLLFFHQIIEKIHAHL